MNDHLTIVSVVDPKEWHEAIVLATADVDRKGQSEYTAAECVKMFEDRILNGSNIVLLAVDLKTGKSPQESVCGMCVLDFQLDFLGRKIACLTYGWIAPGYGRKVFEFAWPVISGMAKKQGCREVWFYTQRDAESFERWASPMRFKRKFTILTTELTI